MIRTLEDKKWVKVGEAEFQLRFISRREWRRISAGFSVLNFESGSEEKKVESSLKLMDYYSELIKIGVCSHKGIIVDGKDYPFQLVEDKVPESLIDFYELNKFIVPLGAYIISFNSLTDAEKKN
jgi:hypothetical protein